MAVEIVTLETLASIDDGRLAAAFALALNRVQFDCKDRPGEKKARKIQLQMDVVPVTDAHGNFEDCKVQFEVHDTVPKRKSKVYTMKIGRAGLLFNDLSPDDVDQMTIDEMPQPRSTNDVG